MKEILVSTESERSIMKKLIRFVLLCTLVALPATSQDKNAQIKTEVMTVLDEFIAAFNKMDMAAWNRTMHFPHYRLARGTMSVLDGPGGRTVENVKRAIEDDWHHSAWSHRKIIHFSDSKVHVDTRFTRYREDGSPIRTYESLYILTKEDGRWGVKLRSSYAR